MKTDATDSGTDFVSALMGTVQAPPQFLTQAAATPTVTQLLDAATAEYAIAPINPPGTSPFVVGFEQLQLNDVFTGAYAKVWMTDQHQLIIAYQGTTGGENLLTNPAAVGTQILDDIGIYAHTVSPAQTAALGFAKEVVATAGLYGISASNVFVTGHSLGGIEAEYVAQQTGLGGIGFETTGIPKSSTTAGDGSNFINTVTYGDPVANYASDVQAEQPFSPAYAPGSAGTLPHYGAVLKIGDPAAAVQLAADTAGDSNPLSTLLSIPALAGELMSYHLPGVQSHALGVTPYDGLIDSFGTKSGPVLQVANDTIAQLAALSGSARIAQATNGHAVMHIAHTA